MSDATLLAAVREIATFELHENRSMHMVVSLVYLIWKERIESRKAFVPGNENKWEDDLKTFCADKRKAEERAFGVWVPGGRRRLSANVVRSHDVETIPDRRYGSYYASLNTAMGDRMITVDLPSQ
jgi:hypothetical protein